QRGAETIGCGDQALVAHVAGDAQVQSQVLGAAGGTSAFLVHEAPYHAARMRRREPELVSVVTPMLNEEGTARTFYERLGGALEGVSWELVVVDDGSTDGTRAILAELAAADERVKVIELSRNFGHQTA